MVRTMRFTVLKICFMGLILLFGGCVIGGGKISVPERYFLAFESQNAADPITVRWSDDGGTSWEAADFTGNTDRWKHQHSISYGVGAAGGQGGLYYLLATSQPGVNNVVVDSYTNYQWSLLGPGVWDGSTASSLMPTSPDTASAPAVAHIDDERFLVTREFPSSKVDVLVFDIVEGEPVTGGPPFVNAPVSSNVMGRPAVSIMNGTIVLAWQTRRQVDVQYSDYVEHVTVWPLVIVTGRFEDGVPVWDTPYELPLPDSYPSGVLNVLQAASDPDLTNDGQRFYLAFATGQDYTRTQLPTPGTGGDTLGPCGNIAAVFSSSDGKSWQFHSNIQSLGVVCNYLDKVSYINIAAHTDGSLLAAAFEGYPNRAGDITVSQFNGTAWTGFTDAQVRAMFGATTALVRQFALIGVQGN